MPRCGIAGNSVFNFLRNIHTVLRTGYSNIYSHQQVWEFPFCHAFSSVCLFVDFLTLESQTPTAPNHWYCYKIRRYWALGTQLKKGLPDTWSRTNNGDLQIKLTKRSCWYQCRPLLPKMPDQDSLVWLNMKSFHFFFLSFMLTLALKINSVLYYELAGSNKNWLL